MKGFVESVDDSGEATRRKLKFKKATTTEAEQSGTQGTGEIVAKMHSGRRFQVKLRNEKRHIGAGSSKMSEKTAVKSGKSIGVARNGGTLKTKQGTSYEDLRNTQEAGSVKVFLREKFWLESRRIIHADGTPWAPKVEVSDTDLDEQVASDENIAPSTKKIEVVNLTKIQDSIDLTAD